MSVVVIHPAAEPFVWWFIARGFCLSNVRGRHRSYLLLSRAKGAM